MASKNLSKLSYVSVKFENFKAFKNFKLTLLNFNILVGPNNAGKSTVLAAFRILAAAFRRACSRNAEIVRGPQGQVFGHRIDLSQTSVAEENIFYNYDDDKAATVTFTLSNGNELTLYFPESGSCYLIPQADGKLIRQPSAFKNNFNCPIGFVPILGPVEHHEDLYTEETAKAALYNYKAARNFRNIWYHFPNRFPEFRETLNQTWPGMDIEPPTVNKSYPKARLDMFCPEERMPREIFWSGFGFQVWCQMLTHIIQSTDVSLFLIDEPDIYLHSDLQRQLLSLLKNMGPDILIATHSTEIITEADSNDIVIIDKKRSASKRIKNPSELVEIFTMLGSNLNPSLTQLAKTKKVLFLEGKDFQIISKFARKLKHNKVANRTDFAVIPIEGFNPDRVRTLVKGIESTLGDEISATVVLDKDYRSDKECASITKKCEEFCSLVSIHTCKEIENFLIVPDAIDKACEKKIDEAAKRGSKKISYTTKAQDFFNDFCNEKKSYILSQYMAFHRAFARNNKSTDDDTLINQQCIEEFEDVWSDTVSRLMIIPGKEALSAFYTLTQEKYGISLTASNIIDAMTITDVPAGMTELIEKIDAFCKQ